jgi:hypothetical protein
LLDSWSQSPVSATVAVQRTFAFRFDFDQSLTAIGADFAGRFDVYPGSFVTSDTQAFVRILDAANGLLSEQQIALTFQTIGNGRSAVFDPIFVGARSDTAQIASLVLDLRAAFNTTTAGSGLGATFEVNQLDLDTRTSVNPVPEPSSVILFSLGAMALASCRRQLSRRRITSIR